MLLQRKARYSGDAAMDWHFDARTSKIMDILMLGMTGLCQFSAI